jgi:hypothetical protein
MTTIKRTVVLVLLAGLWGCTNNLTVVGDFPPPLIHTLPKSIGVLYDDDFRNYIYTEKSEDRSKWIINNGNAQVTLFNRVLPVLFNHVEEVGQIPSLDAPAGTDLVLHPKVIEFQYSVPRETRFKVYEVWIKYNLSLYDNQGELIADWIVTAYGKTPTAFMQSNEEAMNAAVLVALRDLGANLSLGTPRVPEIKAWLQNHSASAQQASLEG